MRAEPIAHGEAEQRAVAEREAAELAAQRLGAQIEAHAAEQLRVDAECRALEAGRRQKEYADASAKQADALKQQCEHVRAEVEAIAKDLIGRMRSDKEKTDAWTVRSKGVIADSPVPAVRHTGIRRPVAALIGGVAFVAGIGVTVATGWHMEFADVSSVSRAISSGSVVPASPVTVGEAAPAMPVVPSRLQMTYILSPSSSAPDQARAKSGK
ncbi:hypothetical protein ACFQUU_06345 [Herbaspirillum sp. GCM10030257]|uniref:hypothetical protein n=1 Tax=Herbaspirillum sp. GCM10030257 TaxID=3273393 RepID=UPI003617B799